MCLCFELSKALTMSFIIIPCSSRVSFYVTFFIVICYVFLKCKDVYFRHYLLPSNFSDAVYAISSGAAREVLFGECLVAIVASVFRSTGRHQRLKASILHPHSTIAQLIFVSNTSSSGFETNQYCETACGRLHIRLRKS